MDADANDVDDDFDFLFVDEREGGDWLLTAGLSKKCGLQGAYSPEELAAEIIVQLSWGLRGEGRPVVLTEGPIVCLEHGIAEIGMDDVRGEPLHFKVYAYYVDGKGAFMLLPGTLPRFRVAAEQLPISDGVIYPAYPDLSTVITVVEYDAIVLRAPAEAGARGVIEHVARKLDLIVEDAKLTHVVPKKHMDHIEEVGRDRLMLLNREQSIGSA